MTLTTEALIERRLRDADIAALRRLVGSAEYWLRNPLKDETATQVAATSLAAVLHILNITPSPDDFIEEEERAAYKEGGE